MTYMWPTKDGRAWIVAMRFEGTEMEPVLKKIKAAGWPRPTTVEGVPSGWEGASDPAKAKKKMVR
jgi:hypothetical protein